MEFLSFVGRVLFASVFILAAWQEFNEFGADGGQAARSLRPKFNAFSKNVSSRIGVHIPPIDIKRLVAGAIFLKGIGGVLFIIGSSLGASLLIFHQIIATPILYDFYNYDSEKKEFGQLFLGFTQNLALFGALLYFVGMKDSIPRRQVRKKTTLKNKAV